MNRLNPATVAIIWMLGTLSSFTLMAIAGRELSYTLSTFEILFFRSIVGLLVLSVLINYKGWVLIRTHKLSTHVVRNVAHFGGQFGWFLGLAYLPLSDVFAIEFTVPIWTAMFAVIMLGERMTKGRSIAILMGFTGMLVILRPGIASIQPASYAVLLGAICYSLAYIKTKSLVGTDSPLSILFYMTIIQLPLGLLPILHEFSMPSLGEWLLITVVAISALTAHYCIARAMQLVDASVVVPMDFMRLPLIALVGFLLYSEPLDWAVLVGGCIMFLGNYINLQSEKRKLSNRMPG
ncbi:DMT family transporter [Alkalimarinus alittae]|uniref:DMT family transporter n=1 Tax=Alkalimarinus alittae TaxID=2961619 RepID=A0ABY6N3B8_9ALTE|nr:DMT family transporter [Alkalimarinus alittae]UZE96612.1 DMT family transporter [Alkalimarinus alittae]